MSAVVVSFKLALWTTALLIPVGLLIGRWLAMTTHPLKPWIEALIMLPLVLPPTVIGYYLLLLFSPQTLSGSFFQALFGKTFVFTFPGLVIASVIVNLPFAVQPVQIAFNNLSHTLREAAWVSGLSPVKTLWHIELPLTWHGLLASITLVFAHTLGEFGVVLMVGGNIDGQTRTISIAIYDSVQSFDMRSAGIYSLALLIFSLMALAIVRPNANAENGLTVKSS